MPRKPTDDSLVLENQEETSSASSNSSGSSISTSVSRRGFIQSAIAAMTATAAPFARAQQAAVIQQTNQQADLSVVAPPQSVKLRINGKQYDLSLEPRVTLLDALREVVGLTGTKKGCDRGQCGACTVLVDGRRVNSCLTLAVMHEKHEITTVEGMGSEENLHPLQAAFIEHDAFQCGYCTPGQLCSAKAMLAEWQAGNASAVTHNLQQFSVSLTDDEIRERMSGNLCRCGAYSNIVAAIRDVAANGKA